MKHIKNYVHLVGNTGRDVELKTFDSGTKKASVSFATTDSYKNTKGEYVSHTQWHNIIAWGRNAELLAKVVEKGDQLIVTGSINYRAYEDKTGISRNVTEILVYDFMRTTHKDKTTPKVTPKTTKPTTKSSKKKAEADLPF